MKITLRLDNEFYEDVKTAAERSGVSTEEVVAQWVSIGHKRWIREREEKRTQVFEARDLGKPLIDLSHRKNWVECLERSSHSGRRKK